MSLAMKHARFALAAASWLLACRSETGGTADFTPVGGYGGQQAGAAGTPSNHGGSSASAGMGGAGAPSNVSGASGAMAGGASGAGGSAGSATAGGQGGASGANTGGVAGSGGTLTTAGAAGTDGASGHAGAGGSSTTSGGAGGLSGTAGNAGSGGNAGAGGAGETAFLMNTLVLRDPHAFVALIGCDDVTDTAIVGFSVNGQIKTSLSADSNSDGFVDLAPVLVFSPLDQQSGDMTPADLVFANCTMPLASTACTPGKRTRNSSTATNQGAGTCLSTLAGTTHPYTPAVTASNAPCFATSSGTITLPLFGTQVPLSDAQIAATYSGNPANGLVSGVMRGFLSQADADAMLIPANQPIVGGQPFSSLLAGGKDACPMYSDMDVDNGVPGWWFYFNFTANRVTWSESP